MDVPELTFTMLLMAPFHPLPESYKPRIIAAGSVDEAMQELGPSLYFSLPPELCPERGISLAFQSINDFHPDAMIEKNDYLSRLAKARDYIASAKDGAGAADIAEGLKQWPGLPIDVSASQQEKPSSTSAGKVDDILSMVSSPAASAPPGGGAPQDWHDQLDQVLRQCLYTIFSDNDFRKYEAAWRGVDLLFNAAPQELVLKLVPASMSALASVLDRLEEDLFNNPPSLIVYDLPFDNSTFATETLERAADLSESLLVPSIAWFNEKFLNLSNWEDLKKLSYLPNLLDQPEFAKWRKLRKSPAAEWMAMTVNRPLLRHAYDADNSPSAVAFREDRHLYLSPVWMLTTLMAARTAETGWPTGLSGPGTSLLSGIPLRQEPDGSSYPVETMLSEDRSNQFLEIGVTPVDGVKNKGEVFVTRAVTASGGSLEYQLVLSTIIRLVFWCRENFRRDMDSEAVSKGLAAVISAYFEKTGQEPPADLEVFAPDDSSGIVSIALTPEGLVDAPRRIELSLNW